MAVSLLPKASAAARTALLPAGAPLPVCSRGQLLQHPPPFTCRGLRGRQARGEKVRDSGTQETPSPGLHYTQSRVARGHLEPPRSPHPVPKFKGDTLKKRSYPAR